MKEAILAKGQNFVSGKTCKQDIASNSGIRKMLYRFYIEQKYGYLGKGNRIQIPQCVLAGIRAAYPEEDGGRYMGFRES